MPESPDPADPVLSDEVRNAASEKDRICQATYALRNVIDYHTSENYLTNETWVGILEGLKYELLKRWHGDGADAEEDWKS